MIIEGIVQSGFGHFERRIGDHLDSFLQATGEKTLYPGTVNVNIGYALSVREDFRMDDPWIEENQYLVFQRCRINGISAYRIRPVNRETGLGGHGDHILEIVCSQKLTGVATNQRVLLEFPSLALG